MMKSGMRIKLVVLSSLMTIAAIMAFWLCRGNLSSPPNGEFVEEHGLDIEVDNELLAITNGITQDFHVEDTRRTHIAPCVSETLEAVRKMTNSIHRLAVARHIARELLALDLTNGSYRIRDMRICDAIRSIPHIHQTLQYANAPELERCDFIFDALQHFKEGAVFTLGVLGSQMVEGRTADGKIALGPDGKPLKFYPSADRSNCAKGIELSLQHEPDYLNNSVFRRMYPNLLPQTQEYFRKRFREVFGIDYIPDEPGMQAYISGEKGTLWDGKGLKWRICDENNNWHGIDKEE